VLAAKTIQKASYDTQIPQMSLTATVTSTRETAPSSLDNILADYQLHHSGGGPATPAISSNATQHRRQAAAGPESWDTTHRRVPPYRPTNRDRDPAETRVYTSRVEQVFIALMFTGVAINAVSNTRSQTRSRNEIVADGRDRQRPRFGDRLAAG
jgi:hypothetical protein